MTDLEQHQDETNSRPSKDQYYLDIARSVAARATCIRRKYGAVIVNEDQIISAGYNGAPRGVVNCTDLKKKCPRDETGAPQGRHYEDCRSVHAEMNAIIHAGRRDISGGTLYLVGRPCTGYTLKQDPEPCQLCKRVIINAGIKTVISKTREGVIKKWTVDGWKKEENDLYKEPD